MSLFRHCTDCHVLIYGTLERCGNCIRRDVERERAGQHFAVAQALVNLKAAIIEGLRSDWWLLRPTHDVLMCAPLLAATLSVEQTWRGQLKAILSEKGVLLYDDPFGEGDAA